MSKIVRHLTTTTETHTGSNREDDTFSKTVETVSVVSIPADRIDASVVREFAAALNKAGAPNNALIDGLRTDSGHLSQLVTRWETRIDPEALAAANADGSAEPVAVEEKTALDKVRDVHRVQGDDGNWNYSPYMRGMFNGLELALAILEGEREPVYRDTPERYLSQFDGPDAMAKRHARPATSACSCDNWATDPTCPEHGERPEARG